MRTVVALSLLFATAALGTHEPSSKSAGCILVVHVTGFRNQKGDAGGTLFKSPEGWPEDNAKAYVHGAFPIEGDHATLTFQDVPQGRYAVAVLHDENSNHKLDRNVLRIPKEGFGFANNPHVGLSAPKWEEAAINVGCPKTEIEVRLIYK